MDAPPGKGESMEEATTTDYPKWVSCRGDLQVLIRPLETRDIDRHVHMLRALPDADLAKLPCNVFDPTYPDQMRDEIENGSVRRLVAWVGNDAIVGSLALYLNSQRWYRHTAGVTQVTHPEYRRYGIGTVLFDEMLPLAKSLNIHKVFTEVSDMHKEGLSLLRSIGMKREGTLREHLVDKKGNFHDLYIYSITTTSAWKGMLERAGEFARMSHRV
ncbi:GNAT family N-acetyltransferase [bacterium]|nr:GNAT family N-acetyltransferase [bacterium]